MRFKAKLLQLRALPMRFRALLCPRRSGPCYAFEDHGLAFPSLLGAFLYPRCSGINIACHSTAMCRIAIPTPCRALPCCAMLCLRVTDQRFALPPHDDAICRIAATVECDSVPLKRSRVLYTAGTVLRYAVPCRCQTPQNNNRACVRTDAPNGDNLSPEHLQRGRCRECL